MRFWVFLVSFTTICGLLSAEPRPIGLQAGEQAVDFLLAAAQTNKGLYTNMESVVCQEQIDRYKGGASGSGKHIDTVTATVSLENGTEQYSNVQQKNRVLPSLTSLEGAWSEGEFGTLLKQTQQILLSSRVSFETEERIGDRFAAVYNFDLTTAESPWDLTVNGRHYIVPFHTKVWVAEPSGEILKIQRTSTWVPEELGILSLYWNVTLGAVDVPGGKRWFLPETADYRVVYRQSKKAEWNTMKFSNYRRYGAEAALRFN